MDIRALVGQNVRRHRLAAELSQEALADAAGLDRTYVSGVERGVRNPTVKVLSLIAGAIGVRAADLLADADRDIPKSSHRARDQRRETSQAPA